MDNKENKKISRKDFLHLTGSVVAGGVIAGTAGSLLWKMIKRPDDVFYDPQGEPYSISDGDTSVSPYRRISSFRTPGPIDAFEAAGESLITSVDGKVMVYSPDGTLRSSFDVESPVRDLAVDGDKLYVLAPAKIAVFTLDGARTGGWDACSDDADYCSLTVTPQGVFVTDAGAKIMVKYRLDGSLDRFIDSPRGFVVPSYSFGVTHYGDVVYCSNPGRHLVESYSAQDGKFLAAFGTAGTQPGRFSGCCNPVRIIVSPSGELITSEKGIPRICCYSREGQFRSVLLNSKALGGGSAAYEVRIARDGRFFVAGKNSVSVFRYDDRLASAGAGESVSSACAICAIECPLKRGVNV